MPSTFDDYLAQSFPGVRITSSKRDPNSPLGRKNPRSYHNIGKAWDVAPLEGMTFDQFRNNIEGAGWNVREAIDEVKNPSRNATGPHWHIAVDGRKEQPMARQTLGSMMGGPGARAPQQFPQRPMDEPQGQMSIANMLQAPLQDARLQQAQMPEASAEFVDMQPLPGIRPRTWGEGGKGWQIMGIIGDALQAAGGGRPTYAPFAQEQQQLETQGRQKLAELMVKAQQKQAERDAIFQNWQAQQDYKRSNPDPTSAARMAQEAGFQPGTPQYKQAILQYMQRPIMIGGEAYAPTSTPSLPQDYNPDEWEVVE